MNTVVAKTGIVFTIVFLVLGAVALCAEYTNAARPSAEDEWRLIKPEMAWGERTNVIAGDLSAGGFPLKPLRASFRAAVTARQILLSGDPLKVAKRADYFLFTDAREIRVGLPPFHERFMLSMVDSHGNLVPKTARGLAFGRDLSIKPKTNFSSWGIRNRGRSGKMFYDAERVLAQIFTPSQGDVPPRAHYIDPAECFVLKQPGLYKMTVTARIYVPDTNGFLMPITIPPVAVDVCVVK